jgi:outer membrane receptor protein involved in Fe transport
LRVKGVAWYQKGGHGLKLVDGRGGDNDPAGLVTRLFESKKYGDIFNVDLSLHYDLKFGKDMMTFGVEILNLLNRKNDASMTGNSGSFSTPFTDEYSMGRQFYASFRYEY